MADVDATKELPFQYFCVACCTIATRTRATPDASDAVPQMPPPAQLLFHPEVLYELPWTGVLTLIAGAAMSVGAGLAPSATDANASNMIATNTVANAAVRLVAVILWIAPMTSLREQAGRRTKNEERRERCRGTESAHSVPRPTS